MIKEIENFIHKDKVYSKCNNHTKEMIDSSLKAVKKERDTLRNEIMLLKRENKALEQENLLKCEEIAKLKKENKGLNTTVENQRVKLDKHFKNLVKEMN